VETVHIVLDEPLLLAVDRAARLRKQNRSALVRDALRGHLRKPEVAAQEARDRQGYEKQPPSLDAAIVWFGEAAWPG
jgi:metal-responsive CopG/Arc/MetJ family transcriptional regulator